MSLRDLSDRELRERAGAKWTAAGPDVLPAWVAEMDFALAEPITAALHDAVDRGAVGYSPSDARTGVAEALATFAADRWSWSLDPGHVVLVPDVMSGIELVLRTLCEDAPVVVPTPAYPPFLDVVPLTGRTLVPLPLSPDGPAVLDLDRLDAALAAGARTVLLCQPHNPWGRVFTRGELEGLRDVVVRHGARVISDEVHAPLVLKGATHVAYATLDGTAAHTSTVLSAAKAWNVPGLRCAQVVTGTPADAGTLRALPLVAVHGPVAAGRGRRPRGLPRGHAVAGGAAATSRRQPHPVRRARRRAAAAGPPAPAGGDVPRLAGRPRAGPGGPGGPGAAPRAGARQRRGEVRPGRGRARPRQPGDLARSPRPHRPAAGLGLDAPAAPMRSAGRPRCRARPSGGAA